MLEVFTLILFLFISAVARFEHADSGSMANNAAVSAASPRPNEAREEKGRSVQRTWARTQLSVDHSTHTRSRNAPAPTWTGDGLMVGPAQPRSAFNSVVSYVRKRKISKWSQRTW